MAFSSANRNVAIKGLGQVTGLLLGLYVFDLVLDVIVPLLYNCQSGYTANLTTQVCQNVSGGAINHSIDSFFANAVTFAQDLLPVVGILGIFYVIYGILAKMGMV